MNRDYAETYEEHKSGKYEYIKGFGRLGCYRGLDYIENLLKNDKYYSEELEDNFIFIQSYINFIEQQCKKQREVINRAVKYIENEMPYLQETDKEYEDINGNTYFTYKEYDGKELLDILKGVENE